MKKVNRVGEKHNTNEEYLIEITEYFSRVNCTIQFEDGNVVKNKQYQKIKDGSIKNLFHPSVCRVGYFGLGKYIYKNHLKIYKTWKSVLERCYNKLTQEKHPTYKDVTICEEWKCFQNFAEWYEENYVEDFHLDKDILFKGNKIYSPETCCFVPREINILFTKCDSARGDYPIGVRKNGDRFIAVFSRSSIKSHLGTFDTPEEAFQAYKIAKEKHIKEMAEKWKSQLLPETSQALISYQVEIMD